MAYIESVTEEINTALHVAGAEMYQQSGGDQSAGADPNGWQAGGGQQGGDVHIQDADFEEVK